ncbi:hypothetical protein GZ77_18040 [Endozoicomonas montiporae]|uniref:Uncharacterized protein n=3 Tax=Endozoicomonas montiporae TaxID=1027273 RepID=A0A081N1V9_9GAMM|nr:TonB-dependent hemoglobin/transferrin/lactoferrin family receptor [Endozoicomonas montiporae]AMO58623.1 TonB-dependent heme/hemoglobin receptor [Endozoicomonas montiporae CL-33]KEQ12432.1 hypothetical protein GZ77_18040 [Endozoicomonas montiporae]
MSVGTLKFFEEVQTHMNPSLIRKSSLSVAIASIVATTAVAQEAPRTQPTLMNQVTVSATRTERELDDIASSVSVITADDAEKQVVGNIRDLVRYEPGVEVTDGGRFGLGGFNIRGMDKNRVKISVDGVDQAKAFGYEKFIQSQRNFFDIDNMKQVDIVKGPASTLHGSDAIGGVVAFTTKDPADYLKAEGDDTYASIKAGYSSADSSNNQSMTIANRSGDLESMLIYNRRSGNEMETYGGGYDGKGVSREEADPQNYKNQSLLGKLQYQINDDHRIGLTAEWAEGESDIIEYSSYGTSTNGMPGETYGDFRADDETKRQRLGVFHEWDAYNAAFDTVKWSLNWQESESNQVSEVERKSFQGGDRRRLDYTYTETSWQFDTTFNKEVLMGSADHLFTYGFNYENKKQDNLNKTYTLTGNNPGTPEVERYAPVATTNQFGVFLQDEISLMNDRLTVTPGIRYDRFEIDTKVDDRYQNGKDVGDRTHNSWTGRLGTVYKVNDAVSVFAQYSEGYSVPDLFALYFEKTDVPAVQVLANPDLKPERSQSIEAGFRLNGDLGSMEVTAFYNTYDDFSEQVYLGRGGGIFNPQIFQYQNLDDTTIKGIELKGMMWLDQFGAPEGSRLNGAVAYAHGRGTVTDMDGVLHENEPLNSIAPLKAFVGLGYDAPYQDWGGDLSLTLVSRKKTRDISNTDSEGSMDDHGGRQFATPGYGLVDLTAYYKPHQDITLSAGIFNIGDKKYWMWDDVRGFSNDYAGINRLTQPGRNYSVSVKWEI